MYNVVMPAKRILTGDRPTGPLHLGHYFGTLMNRVALQKQGYDTFIIVADYQVLTDRLETENIKRNIYELVKDYLAVGLDPDKTTIFIQSQIPQLSELTLLFSMLVSMARVSRNPTVKEEIKAMNLSDNVSLGMFSYPVSQAADILLFNADTVPVGEDQLPHIEVTREIARKFNATYGELFTVPEAKLSDTPRLVGLDGSDKMSKSRGNAIFLSDQPDVVNEKIKKAVTDSGNEIVYDRTKKPNLSNLLDLFAHVSGKDVNQIASRYETSGYKEFKDALSGAINEFLFPIQESRSKISDEFVWDVIARGNKKAREVGEETLLQAKTAMKMDYL
ncbi:tryptophan--tRNA ligase [candidate division WWE3 bacterium CG_4_10_14_0_2_um_filter_41_14]|uniref:Tryptophan--tRNA ligase n=1 Tax=candidate division WWE3 bacterium CG_4_10_14_0_2_um_filter_41_14 TaxID=1975072 RepID=A0A2M7THP5_UNCKA|nr:MAG: tryptophan--tRNA ligase [candidate division WWE3 bacterium CG_4_10_14_0_2_um_filter_41_14]